MNVVAKPRICKSNVPVVCLDLSTGLVYQHVTSAQYIRHWFGKRHGAAEDYLAKGQPFFRHGLWAWKEGCDPPMHEQQIATEFFQTFVVSDRFKWPTGVFRSKEK